MNLEGLPRGGQIAAPVIQCKKRTMCRIEGTNLGGEDRRDEEEERGEGIHIVGMSEDSRRLMDLIFIQCSAWLCSSGKPPPKRVH